MSISSPESSLSLYFIGPKLHPIVPTEPLSSRAKARPPQKSMELRGLRTQGPTCLLIGSLFGNLFTCPFNDFHYARPTVDIPIDGTKGCYLFVLLLSSLGGRDGGLFSGRFASQASPEGEHIIDIAPGTCSNAYMLTCKWRKPGHWM